MTVTLKDSVQRFRLNVIRRAQALGNVRQACREAGISRERLAAVQAQGLLGGLLTERTRKELRLARSLEERHSEATRPGEVIQIDTFYIGKLKGVGKVWQYTACDAYGSYGLARLAPGEVNAADAATFLREVVVPAYERAGHVIRRVTVDGGTEFKGLFRVACKELGIQRYQVGPRRPWTSGVVAHALWPRIARIA